MSKITIKNKERWRKWIGLLFELFKWIILCCACVKHDLQQTILYFQYYDTELYPSMKEQKNFEKNVFNKTHKADSRFFFQVSVCIWECLGSEKGNIDIINHQFSLSTWSIEGKSVLMQ